MEQTTTDNSAIDPRARGFGASEAAVIYAHNLGLSDPFRRTLFDLVKSKREMRSGKEREKIDSPAMEWGHRLESVVREKWAESRPQYFVLPGNDAMDPLVFAPGLSCSPDAVCFDRKQIEEKGIEMPERLPGGDEGVAWCRGLAEFGILPTCLLEIKTGKAWEDGTVPWYYRTQAVHQQAWAKELFGVLVPVHFALLSGGRDYVEDTVEPVQYAIEEQTGWLVSAWNRYVVGDEPCPVSLLAQITARSDAVLKISAAETDQLVKIGRRVKEVEAQLEATKAEREKIRAQILSKYGGAKKLISVEGSALLSRVEQTRESVDTERLKRIAPEVFAQVVSTKTSVFWR